MRQLKRRGGNAIEFALILPVLVAVFTGIIDYGWIYAVRTAATSSARAGARVGALTPKANSPDTAASAAAQAKWDSIGLPLSSGDVLISAGRVGTPKLMVVRVRVTTSGLVGLVPNPTGDILVTASQPMEEQ